MISQVDPAMDPTPPEVRPDVSSRANKRAHVSESSDSKKENTIENNELALVPSPLHSGNWQIFQKRKGKREKPSHAGNM